MNDHAQNHDDRLLELLAEQMGAGLDSMQADELGQLIEQSEHPDDLEGLELAAAAVYEAFATETEIIDEPMPVALSEKLIAEGEARIASKSVVQQSPAILPFPAQQNTASSGLRHPAWGWLAAAAVLAISATTWLVMSNAGSTLDYRNQRERLMADVGDVTQARWAESDDPVYGKVSGDVVWSDQQQRGYMRLVGMPVNDPGVQQYQLWIVDPDVDAHPVDGGVFDVNADGEVIIPIDAKLRVDKPTVFAITVEKPGGVVVSQGPLRVVAAVGT